MMYIYVQLNNNSQLIVTNYIFMIQTLSHCIVKKILSIVYYFFKKSINNKKNVIITHYDSILIYDCDDINL